MALNEIMTTSGDIRRLLADTMVQIKNGTLPVERGLAVAALSKEITSSMQAEVNVAKVRVAMLVAGKSMGEITTMGRLVIGDDGPVALNGSAYE